jgi:Apea-like HEPN
MPEINVNFIGLLANVESSILKVKLDHGFKIESMSQDEGIGLISILDNLPPIEVHKKLFMDIRCLNTSEKKLYFISNSFKEQIEMNGSFPSKSGEFNLNFVDGYLNSVIKLMRLFKEGNICMPSTCYYYFTDNNIPHKLIGMDMGSYIYAEPIYTLENTEIPTLQKFVQETKLPFGEPFLQMAFENFELSYQIPNLKLSFLSLMISLEILFHPGDRNNISYKISRNAAVLLGNEDEELEKIYEDIKNDLYAKRSSLVHSGESDINKDDVLKLRSYIRESIKKIYNIGKPKDDLLKIWDSSGFLPKKKK